MKLYMRQKLFTWIDRFSVRDESGDEKYYIEGEFLSWGKKLHIYDAARREVAFIRQKLFHFMPTFVVYIDGVETARIIKEFTFFKQSYTIEGLGYHVDGDIFAHDYSISADQYIVADIHKAWMSWGDSYEIDISPQCDEITVLATVLAIDCALATQNSH